MTSTDDLTSVFHTYLEWEADPANQKNHCHWYRNNDNTVHHELQGSTGIEHSVFPSICDRCKARNGHHQQLHGSWVQIMVCISRSSDPENEIWRSIKYWKEKLWKQHKLPCCTQKWRVFKVHKETNLTGPTIEVIKKA